MRRPSTRISSTAGSTLTPIVKMVLSLTVTRPSAMSFSAARREAMPACDNTFWRRVVRVAPFTAGSLALEHLCPQADQLQDICVRGRTIHFGMRDQLAEQHVNVGSLSTQAFTEDCGLGSGNHRIAAAVKQKQSC